MSKPFLRIAAALFFVTLTARAQPGVKDPNHIRVTFVNIGAGLCTVIECPGDPNQTPPILYDCGSNGRGDTGLSLSDATAFIQAILSRYVPPRIVVSHPDGDHYNFIPTIMGSEKANSIWLGGARSEYSFPFQTWLANQQQGVTINEIIKEGDSNGGQPVGDLACGTGQNTGTWLLTASAGASDNAKSAVLRIVYNQFSATMTGDATVESLASLMYNFPAFASGALNTTLLSAPHHGATTEGSSSFLWPLVFQPEIVVYSAGNLYYHPRCAALEVYLDDGRLLQATNHTLQCGSDRAYFEVQLTSAEYLTRTNGTISIEADGQGNVQVTCIPQGCTFN